MSIATKAPPYDGPEVERMARALVEHRAHGAFFSSKDGKECFELPLKTWGAPSCLEALEKGCLYLVGFAPDGVIFAPNGFPKLTNMVWLDAKHTRLVLHRCFELEGDLGDLVFKGGKPKKELERLIAYFEGMRVSALPELRKMLMKGIVIS